MAIPVEMPKMSDTMEEGVLVSWMVDEGAEVSAGDIIAQVETDKATMDLEVYDDGVLLKRVIGEGDAVPIGGLIAVLGDKGEDISDLLAKYESGAGGDGQAGEAPESATSSQDSEEVPEPSSNGETETVAAPSAAPASRDGRPKASPLARRLAQEHGLELSRIRGSGPEGRIVKRDIEDAIGQQTTRQEEVEQKPAPGYVSAPVAGQEHPPQKERISQMRKAIARRLSESKFSAPHFYLTIDVDMERAVEARQRVNKVAEDQNLQKVSFNDIITKACAVALRQHPMVNSSYMDKEGEIHTHQDVHVAVAVAIDEGLMTPVIRHADQKGLTQIAVETRELASKARNRKLQPEEWEGSTFTTSNLGMFGIEEFTAIINPPNACILAIGAIRDVPIVEDGNVRVGKRMKLTLSCDHRVVDGATGAQFLDTLRNYLEEPLNLLL